MIRSGIVAGGRTGARIGGQFGGVASEGAGFRHPLLQHQQGGLEQRVGLEAALHRAVVQQVGQGQEAHALVVGHEGAHHRVLWPRGRRAPV
jgi:hypothetical protein